MLFKYLSISRKHPTLFQNDSIILSKKIIPFLSALMGLTNVIFVFKSRKGG